MTRKSTLGAKIDSALAERLLAPFGGARTHGAMARAVRRLIEIGLASGEWPDAKQPDAQASIADDPGFA